MFILPIVGAVLIIAVGGNGANVVSRALSVKPMVFLGKLSYSL